MIRKTNIEEFDKYLAIIGIVSSIFLIPYLFFNFNRIIYLIPIFLTLISCIIWIMLSKKINLMENFKESHDKTIILASLFFIFLTISILTLYFRPNLYERPLIYFLIISMMAGIIAIEILYSPHQKKYSFLILVEIIILVLNLQYSQLLIYPDIVGIDPWYHQMFTTKIVENGFIPEGFGYSKLPIMHLGIGSTSLITGLNYKLSTMFSMELFQVICGILFTFLLGKYLFNNKIGLFSSLVLAIADQFIHWGFWFATTSIAAIIMIIIIYILVKLKMEKLFLANSLAILLMMVLILTHTLTSMCMAIVLFVVWISPKIYEKIYGERLKQSTSILLPIVFTISMFSWWIYASGHITTLLDLINFGFGIDYFSKGLNVEYSIPFLEQIFNQIGMFLFFSISFIGCFYMISKKYGNSQTFIYAIVGISPLAIGFFSLITGHTVIQHRWWYFAQLLLAIPLAIALYLFLSRIKLKKIKPLFLFCLVSLVAFLMVMNPTASIDIHTFSTNSQGRHALLESEFQALNTISQRYNGTFGGDWYYARANHKGYKIYPFDEQLYNKNFDKFENLFLIRKYILNNPFSIFGAGLYKTNYDLISFFDKSNSKIYNSETVYIYT